MTNNIAPLVLVVDDEVGFLEVMQAKLESQGFQTITAIDGNDAIAKAKREKPAIILMDIEMPNKDGMRAVADLATMEETKNIPVIFLTNLRKELVESLAARISFHINSHNYFKKEDDYNKLMARIHSVVGVA